MKKVFLILLLCGCVLSANAALVPLEIASTVCTPIGEYDAAHDGLEWIITYTVYNPNAAPGGLQDAMEVKIPFGNGVYRVEAPAGWGTSVDESYYIFNTVTNFIFSPGSEIFTFYIDDDYTDLIEGGTLEGTSCFNGAYPPGERVMISSIPEPATFAILGLGLFFLKRFN